MRRPSSVGGGLALVGLLLALASPAEARRRRREAEPRTVAVPAGTTHALKPLEAIGIEPARVTQVTDALAAQMAQVPGVQVAPLAHVRAVLKGRQGVTYATCEGELDCFVRFGALLMTPLLVSGELSGIGKGYVIFLRLVDVKTATEVRKVSLVFDGTPAREAPLLREAAYRLLAPEKFVGRLQVEVDLKGAAVFLDGHPLGQSPIAPQPVAAGTHALRVTHPQYHDFVRFVDVAFDQVTTVKVSLTMYPVISEEVQAKARRAAAARPVPDPRSGVIYRPLPWYKRWWFVTTVGVVVLGGTLGAVLGSRRMHVDRDVSVVIERPVGIPILRR